MPEAPEWPAVPSGQGSASSPHSVESPASSPPAGRALVCPSRLSGPTGQATAQFTSTLPGSGRPDARPPSQSLPLRRGTEQWDGAT